MRDLYEPSRTRILFPAILLLAAGVEAGAQQGPLDGMAASPTIAGVAEGLSAGDPGAVAGFWAARSEEGTPLVEAAGMPEGYSLVTFLYRGESDVAAVRLASNLNVLLLQRPGQHPDSVGSMARLDGSDIWFLSLRLRNDIRVPYRFRVVDGSGDTETLLDPLNPVVWEPDQEALAASVLELRGAPEQPWRTATGVEGDGDWDQWRFDEAPDSGRMVYIYKPPGWSADREERFPVLVGLGAFGHGIGMRVDRVVDHLVRTGRIPPIVVVLADLEQDAEATRYRSTGEFVANRLLPMLREHYRATADPDHVVVSGTSRRGMVASLVALRHPDAVRNVLSLSGSYYWAPADAVEPEWVTAQYAVRERRPLRFHLAAGELEMFVTPGNRGHPLLVTNRHFRNVLRAAGYPLTYREFNGVHSELSWQDQLAAGLVGLIPPSSPP